MSSLCGVQAGPLVKLCDLAKHVSIVTNAYLVAC
jgi:hypothetical protein